MLVVLLAANTIISNIYVQRSIKVLLIKNQTQILVGMMNSITEELRRMDHLALMVLFQDSLKLIMEEAGKEKDANYFTFHYNEARIVRTLASQIIGPEEIPLRITLFNREGDHIDYGWQPVNKDISKELYLKGTINSIADSIDSKEGGKLITVSASDIWYDKVQEPVFSVYRELRDLSTHYGYIQVQEFLSVITDKLQQELPGTFTVLQDEKDKIIFNSLDKKHPDWLYDGSWPLTLEETEECTYTENKNGGFYRMSIRSAYSGWTLNLYQDMGTFLKPIKDQQLLYIFMALLLLFLGVMLIRVLTNFLTKPLKELHESIYKVNSGNLQITLEEKDSHQIVKQLNSSFQLMFQRLQKSMDEQIQSKESEARAHMSVLQNQINPHLLYNMLSLISNFAAEEETDKIEEICQRLSRSLRYIGNSPENPVSLRDEINHLKDYLILMSSHYTPLFNFSFDIELSNLDQIDVPKLIFQPLAENAFYHGFQNIKPPWHLQISLKREQGNYWAAQFTDNGEGITPEKAQELLKLKDEPLSVMRERAINHFPGGLALMNIITRMRLFYKDKIIFKITGSTGNNTVTIGGPLVSGIDS